MNRRDTIKSLVIGSVATVSGGVVFGCTNERTSKVKLSTSKYQYGRTDVEKIRDEKLNGITVLQSHELETLADLCDIILPTENMSPSASAVGVVDFIEFMLKDDEKLQRPFRGGLLWLNTTSIKMYSVPFVKCTSDEKIALVDKIAFTDNIPAGMEAGVHFFSLLRNLVITGYYTSKEGIKELGYKGNTPNVWDGVPQNVLDEHHLSYNQDWLDKCIDQNKRNIIAEWDEKGKLIT